MGRPGWVDYNGYSREQALQSVGPGWAPLVNRVFDVIDEEKLAVLVVQVKEKFGGLRIYAEGPDYERLAPTIFRVEAESYGLCEQCGNPGLLHDVHGWYRTLCPDHAGEGVPKEAPWLR